MLKKWKKLLFGGSLLLGVGLFVFVFYRFFSRDALDAVIDFGWRGMAIFLPLAALTLVAPAIAWTILMRGEGMKVPLWTAVKANLMGFPINFVAPTMFLGAEPLKMLYVSQLHKEPKRRVLATIIVAKFQEIGALLLVMIVAAAVSVWRIKLNRTQEILLIASMGLLALVFASTLYAFVRNLQPSVRMIEGLARVKRWRRKLARLRTTAEEMEHLIHAAFTKRWKTFLAAQAITLVSAFSILMRPWVFFYLSKEHVLLGMETLCAIYLATNVINSLPHTPGSLGTFEFTMVVTFGLVGIGKSNAMAFALVTRASDVFLLLLGTWMIVHYGLQSVAKRVAKGEETVTVHDAQAADGDAGPPGTTSS